MKIQALVFSMMLLGILLFASTCLAADYYVYCAKGSILIDTRNPAQMMGSGQYSPSNLKELIRFSNQKDAATFAQHKGGVGAKCK